MARRGREALREGMGIGKPCQRVGVYYRGPGVVGSRSQWTNSGPKALPVDRDRSGDPPRGPRGVVWPFQRGRRGWESFPKGRVGLGGPAKGREALPEGQVDWEVLPEGGRLFLRAGRGRNVFLEGQ